MAQLLIIHADADGPFVRGYLVPALALGEGVVRLSGDLPPGVPMAEAIAEAVATTPVRAAILSPDYLQDRWQMFGTALSGHIAGTGGGLVPVLLRSCRVPLSLDFRVALDLTDPRRRAGEVARLRKLITDAPPPGPPPAPACPYPRLEPIGDTSGRFYGRGPEIRTLAERLDAGQREIYVHGPSSSAKSSMIAAGLVPRVTAADRGDDRYRACSMRPGREPAQALRAALAAASLEPQALTAAVAACLAKPPAAPRLLLVLDQLEELFTQAPAAEQDLFIAALRALRRDARVTLVAVLRSEFLGLLKASPLWIDRDDSYLFDLGPMNDEGLREVIIGPARSVGVEIDPALVDDLVRDARQEPAALPLLQVTLRQLWADVDQYYLSAEAYVRLTGHLRRRAVHGSALAVAFSDHADQSLHELGSPAREKLARRILLRLVQFAPDSPADAAPQAPIDTVRRRRVRELREPDDPPQELEDVLDHLTGDALVATDAERRADGRAVVASRDDAPVDLAHEALLTYWPRLREWVDERREQAHQRDEWETLAREWDRRGRAAAFLDQAQIDEATQWLGSEAARDLGVAPAVRELVAASRARLVAAERRRSRLRWIITVALGVVAVVVTTLWIYARRQTRRARAASALAERRLAESYQEQARFALADDEPLDAITYLAAAARRGLDNPTLRVQFREATRNLRLFTVHQADMTRAVTFDDAGELLATGDCGGRVRIWDAATGEVRAVIRVSSKAQQDDGACDTSAPDIETIRFTPDGRRLLIVPAYTGTDHGVGVWNVDGTPAAAPVGDDLTIRHADLSPDGSEVVTASGEHGVVRWRLADMTAIETYSDGCSDRAQFNQDGSALVTACGDRVIVWEITGHRQRCDAPLEIGELKEVAFTRDGRRLAIVGSRRAGLLDAATCKGEFAVTMPDSEIITARLSPDRHAVLVSAVDSGVQVWDLEYRQPRFESIAPRTWSFAAAWSPDGARIAIGGLPGVTRVHDALRGRPLSRPLESIDDETGFRGDVMTAAAFSPDGSRLATATMDGVVDVWDVGDDRSLLLDRKDGHELHATLIPSRGQVLTVERAVDRDTEEVGLWQLDSGRPLPHPFAQATPVLAVVGAPDGARLVTGPRAGAAGLRLWSQDHAALEIVPPPGVDVITNVALAPDGRRLVAAANDAAWIWNGQGWSAPLHVDGQHSVAELVLDRRGERVALVNGPSAQVFSLTDAKPLSRAVTGSDSINAATFIGPDTLATSHADGSVQLWGLPTGIPAGTEPYRRVGRATGSRSTDVIIVGDEERSRFLTADGSGVIRIYHHSAADRRVDQITRELRYEWTIDHVAFSPDGTRVVATGNGPTRIWEVASGRLLVPPLGDSEARWAAFTLEGRWLVTAGYEEVRVWDLVGDPRGPLAWSAVAARHGRRIPGADVRALTPQLALPTVIFGAPPPTVAGELSRVSNLLATAYVRLPGAPARARAQATAAATILTRIGRDDRAEAVLALALIDVLDRDLPRARARVQGLLPLTDADLVKQLAAHAESIGRADLAARVLAAVPTPPD